MIFDSLFSFILYIPNYLLDKVGNVAPIGIPDAVFNWINNMFTLLGYFLPLKALLPILAVSFSIKSFQIGWALFLKLKSLIPTCSD